MESAVVRSFQFSLLKPMKGRPGMITMNNAAFCRLNKLPVFGQNIISSANRHGTLFVSCVKKTSEAIAAEPKGTGNGAVLSAGQQNGLPEKKPAINAKFPNGFEVRLHLPRMLIANSLHKKKAFAWVTRALLSEVCDETKIAELKVKLGAFEMHMKRNIDGPKIPAPVFSQTAIPAVSSEPASEATSVPPAPSKSSEKVSPFTNVSVEKAAKLAKLEASGSSGYVIVLSPSVGSFRRVSSRKGKKQPPACKEGDVIKEGQIIGFLDQFCTELPVRSDVAGEVLKLLYTDGEAVGYGDPLIAVLPSFAGIK